MDGVAWGGSEELWSQTALRLLAEGHAITASVKLWPETPKQIKALKEAGCHLKLRPHVGLVRLAAQKIAARLGLPAESWLNAAKPDLVVISQGDTYSAIEWAEQCRKRRIPYALIAQAAAPYWWIDDIRAARAARCYEEAAASYFVSNSNLNVVRMQLATPLVEAKVVRNPFNVSYDNVVPWPESNDGTLRLACVGRLDINAKGQDILFDVLKKEKWKQRTVTVSLFGNGSNRAVLEKLKEQYGLNNVVFAGFTSGIEDIWKTHHALVLPSRLEGLPLVLVEAMLCGRPAIVTDVAGNAELLEEGITGFIAAAATARHLDEALERTWEQRENLCRMGSKAAECVREQVPRDPIGEFVKELNQIL